MKKSILFLAKTAPVLIILLFSTTAMAWTGSGTSANPYRITSADDLAQLASDVNGGTNYDDVYFKQTADITLSGEWTPIGNSSHPFKGHYDGGGFAISGLKVTGNYQYAGLFGVIASGDYVPQQGVYRQAKLKDIHIVDCNISVGGVTGSKAGGIAGQASTVDMSGCRVSGSITGFGYACGLIGYIDQTSGVIMTNCFVDVTLTGTGNQYIIPQVRLMACVSGGSPSASGNYCHDNIGNVSTGISATPLYMVTGAPSGVMVAATNATLTYNAKHYFATGATATLTVDDSGQKFNTFSVTGASGSSVAANKKSATVTFASSDATVTATLQYISFTDDDLSYLCTGGTGVKVTACNSSATSVTIPTTVSYDNVTYNVTAVDTGAFSSCASLIFLILQSTTPPSLGSNALDACTALNAIVVPKSALEAYKAAANWSAYATKICDSYGSCGTTVYYSYNSGTKTLNIFGIGAMADYNSGHPGWYGNSSSITTVVIGNGVTSIGSYAFEDFNALTSITIPASVTNIGNLAFYNCTSLTNITIPTSVTNIGISAFRDCNSLTSIEIPASVTTINEGIFGGCFGLTSITVADGNTKYYSEGNCLIKTDNHTLVAGCKSSVIPEDVTSIGSSAFFGCTSLTNITIPASVTSIGGHAFRECTGLTSLSFGSGVKSISDGAFYECTGLTSIEIPASMTSIGYTAFYNCINLASVIIYAPSLSYYGVDAFGGNKAGRKIYVFNNSVDTYKSGWSAYANDIEPFNPTLTVASAAVLGESKYVTTFYHGTLNYQLPEGAVAYTAGKVGEKVVFYRIGENSDVIPKNTAVVIVADPSAVTEGKITLSMLDSAGGVSVHEGNILHGSDVSIAKPAGTVYVLGTSGEPTVLGFYQFSGTTIPAAKAYYVVN